MQPISDDHRGWQSVNVSFFQDLLNSVAEQGRQFLPWAQGEDENLVDLGKALVSGRGEASGVAIAREILDAWRVRGSGDRRAFYQFLADGLEPEPKAVKAMAEAYLSSPSPQTLARLQHAVESPRQEFFRRLNRAPGATATIVMKFASPGRLEPISPPTAVVAVGTPTGAGTTTDGSVFLHVFRGPSRQNRRGGPRLSRPARRPLIAERSRRSSSRPPTCLFRRVVWHALRCCRPEVRSPPLPTGIRWSRARLLSP